VLDQLGRIARLAELIVHADEFDRHRLPLRENLRDA